MHLLFAHRLNIARSAAFLALLLLAAGCLPAAPNITTASQPGGIKVLAVESFLADMAQNVAGDRATVETLIPRGLDPHAFEPTPADLARIAESDVLMVNGGGFESWLDETLSNAGGQRTLIEASKGLDPRLPGAGEPADEHGASDPHFWLDPQLAARYVENIRDGLIQADPAGKDTYTTNAAAYIQQLTDLDASIAAQLKDIPPGRRLMVTNHESFGYFADRYNLRIIGAILPSVTSSASPSAAELAALVEAIRSSGAPAIFMETGSNPELAGQLAQETGVQVVTDLYTHSLSDSDGPAPTYIEMMKHNAAVIAAALR